MSLDSDVIVDRRRIRRKLTFWRVAAVVVAIAAVVLAQKLFPPRRTLDLSLALAIIALGIATAAA